MESYATLTSLAESADSASRLSEQAGLKPLPSLKRTSIARPSSESTGLIYPYSMTCRS